MAVTIAYDRIQFRQLKDVVRGQFMKMFYFELLPAQLEVLGTYSITQDGSLVFDDADEQEAHAVMDKLVSIGLSPEHLRNSISKNPVNYLYRGCGVPLIGSNVFGVVDRGTSLIEVKPITSCNLQCVYCSVGEGGDEKEYDFVIEPEYLFETVRDVLVEKGLNHKDAGVEIHMSVHGEPFLYSEMITLTKLLRTLSGVKHIATDTNGTLLTEQYVDQLAEAGFTRVNISIDSMDPELSYKMVGRKYDHAKLLHMIRYLAKHPKMDVLIAPVWMQGTNDAEIEKLVAFAKELNIVIGIQNFMNYSFGRNPQKEISWDEFKEKLAVLEKKYDYKLIMNLPKDFAIYKVDSIKKPMKKNQIVSARIVRHGNHFGEKLGIFGNRVITIPATKAKMGDTVDVRITRDKHNIYFGVPIKEKIRMEHVEFGMLAP